MSMSQDMVKGYVKAQLAKAVSVGILKGETDLASGHTHKFAVMFDESNEMFVGETSYNGSGPHVHYIMMGIQDIVQSHLSNQEHPRTEDTINVEVNVANAPANMRRIIEFYNLKTIAMVTSPSFPDNHTHTLVVKFAGHNVDQMGRKVEASIFDGQEHLDADVARAKAVVLSAEEKLETILTNVIHPSIEEHPTVTLPIIDTEDIKDVVDGDPKTTAELLVEELRGTTKKAEEELMARVETAMKAESDKKNC